MGPLTIYADMRITRRKMFVVLCDMEGRVLYRSRLLGAVLEHALALEPQELHLTYVVERQDIAPLSFTLTKD